MASRSVGLERAGAVSVWLPYAAAALGIAAVLAGAATLALPPADARGVRLAATAACAVQLAAFALLVRARAHANLFLMGWVAGMLLRFGALAALAFWVTRSGAAPAGATLLSLAGFLFVFLMLEPLFLRRVPKAT